MVTLVAESSNLVFLEGCMRAFIDGSNKTTWLSSGTEDFFLSAYYFNEGLYHLDNAGLTFLENGRVSAYKFFENDPLLFSKSFELWWRCSDNDISRVIYGCPNTWPDPTPPRNDEFFAKYHVMKDKLYKAASLSKEELDSKLQFSGKEELSSEEKIVLKQKIAKEGAASYEQMAPTTVTTYTWVYEW